MKYPAEIDAGPIRLVAIKASMAEEMRELVLANFDRLHTWMPWAATRPTVESQREAFEAAERKFNESTDWMYAIVESSTGAILGGTGLHQRSGPTTRETGYWITSTHEGRGLTKRAVLAMQALAFQDPEIERFEIRCNAANVGSAAVAKSCGLELVEIRDAAPETPGESDKEMMWSMPRDLYQSLSVEL